MFILLNIKHFYMVELEHLPIAHFLLFYLHASRLTVNTEGPWWWPGGMGMEVNATRRKPKTSCWCSKSISQHHLLLSIVYCRNMANTSAINKEGAEGKISDGIQKRRIQSMDSHYCQSYCIALHMGHMAGKKLQKLTTCQWEKICHMNRIRDKKKDSKSEGPYAWKL